VHALVILNGRRLTRADFAALRDHARNRALTQRRYKDKVRRLELLAARSRSYEPPFARGGTTSPNRAYAHTPTASHTARYYARRDHTRGPVYHPVSVCPYSCPVCGRYQALPYSREGYRCLLDGAHLRREKERGYARTQTRGYGFERELTL
jgi:hypothetical protein